MATRNAASRADAAKAQRTSTTPDPKPDPAPAGPPAAPKLQDRKCLCGCGAHVSDRANYRPGHDARHAGDLGKALATARTSGLADRTRDLQSEIETRLPSRALREKALGIADRLTREAEERARRDQAREDERKRREEAAATAKAS